MGRPGTIRGKGNRDYRMGNNRQGALVKGRCILFPGPLQQCTKNGVTSNNRNVLSHSPGSQKPGIKALAGPRTLWWLHGSSLPCLSGFWCLTAKHPWRSSACPRIPPVAWLSSPGAVTSSFLCDCLPLCPNFPFS